MAGMVSRHVSKNGHFLSSRGWEITIGAVLAIVGMILLWDAFDGRNRKMPWPLSGLAPW